MTDFDNSLGFIITRHVTNQNTNKYWIFCCNHLFNLYPKNKIIVIDDGSNPEFVTPHPNPLVMENVTIVQTEYLKCGELLPYVYLIKNPYFDNAVIIHDSVFFHAPLDFQTLIKKNIPVATMWHFKADRDNIYNSIRVARALSNNYQVLRLIHETAEDTSVKMLSAIHKPAWVGSFGAQAFVNRDFLLKIQEKYNLLELTNHIKCRLDRCTFERIIGIIFSLEYPAGVQSSAPSLLGNIQTYQSFGYPFENFLKDVIKHNIKRPVTKVWTGR